jgi:flagellar hook-associated protein 1
LSDLLNIGSSALAAYRHALTAVGENVANAETPGYSRRSVTLKEVRGSGGSDPIYRPSIHFNGVTATGVARAWDEFRASEARRSASDAGQADVRQQWLTGVESALDDGPSGVGNSLTTFFNSAANLAAHPDDALGRLAMLTSLEDVATAFRRTGGSLERTSEGIAASARLEVDGVNNALDALHDINGSIRTAMPGGSARASLEDERDRLIDFLAERLDVTASVNGDGTANLHMTGASSVSLLSGPGPGQVGLATATDGRLSLALSINGTTVPLPVASGKLAGFLDVATTTADKRAALDLVASDFAASINDWSAGGLDANGAAGADLVEAPAGAASLRVIVTDPDAIAAAATDGTANGNLLALETVRETSGIEARWAGLVSANAQALASARSEASATASWRDYSYASLDEVTGIDLDHEAAQLLRFQQAYNGSARIIQVARETINAIFDLF